VTRDEQLKVAYAHAAAETDMDLEGTLATLDPDPVYELQPLGVEVRGMAGARAYYEHFFANFMPLIEGFQLRDEWVNDHGLAQEYVMQVRDPATGAVSDEPIIGILVFGTEGLAGERLYGSESLFQRMFGPVLAQAVPVGS